MKLRTAPAQIGTLPRSTAIAMAEIASPTTSRLRGRAGVARRDRILLRDGFTCRLCSRIAQPRDLRVDHITPLAMGGSDTDDTNLRTLCVPCHDRVTREEFGHRPRRR